MLKKPFAFKLTCFKLKLTQRLKAGLPQLHGNLGPVNFGMLFKLDSNKDTA
jgi:hypothetical protein